MLKKRYIFLKDLIIIIIFLLVFVFYFGNRFLKRLNTFIIENNNIMIKNDLNTFINSLSDIDYNNVYSFKYDDKGYIVGAEYNALYINKHLSLYTNKFKDNINRNLYNKYIKKFFKKIKVSDNNYLLVPMGIISDNPFIYNFGPNIFLSYDYITTYTFKLNFDAKNYGLNNILVNLYLDVYIDQSIFKPVLNTTNHTTYRFLLSSQVVYGKMSDILSAGINLKSDNL